MLQLALVLRQRVLHRGPYTVVFVVCPLGPVVDSSDGERGGDGHYDNYLDGTGMEDAMGDGEFGGGPWPGEDPCAYGGVG